VQGPRDSKLGDPEQPTASKAVQVGVQIDAYLQQAEVDVSMLEDDQDGTD